MPNSHFFSLSLPGSFTMVSSAPSTCAACHSKHLYQQSDFKRGLGLWLVGFACVMSLYLNFIKANWFLTWSPMLVFLFIDRFFAWTRPTVVICYECQHLHRGLSREQCKAFTGFDLEVNDRLKFKADSA